MHKLLAWWQLLRIGNVFTAASNVIAGFLIVQGGWEPVGPLLVLIAASALLYTAGMVLNDVFDAELDAVERPERPIPSGRISLAAARRVGWVLLVGGVVAAGWVSWLSGNPCSGAVGVLLACCIVLYDVKLKSTPFGPFAMGVCRMLNVLLGASMAASFGRTAWTAAAVVGVYTIGISFYARSELEEKKTVDHIVGKRLIALALVGLLLFPLSFASEEQFRVDAAAWGASWLVVFLATVGSAWLSSRGVTSAMFRRHVTAFLHGFILIDACVSIAVAGWAAGLILASLLIPTWIASRFAPMT